MNIIWRLKDLYEVSYEQLQPWSNSKGSHFQLLKLILWNVLNNISFLIFAILGKIYWFPALGDEFFHLLCTSHLLPCI